MLDRTASGCDDFVIQLTDLNGCLSFNGTKACFTALLKNFRNGFSCLFNDDIIQIDKLLLHTVFQHFADRRLAGGRHTDKDDIAALL